MWCLSAAAGGPACVVHAPNQASGHERLDQVVQIQVHEAGTSAELCGGQYLALPSLLFVLLTV
jgi:hypothetical protein